MGPSVRAATFPEAVRVCDGQHNLTRVGSQKRPNMILFLRFLFLAAVWRVADGKLSPPYSSNGDCFSSTSEYYIKPLGLCCSRCKPGTRLVEQCTSIQDTICSPCPDGQYSENMNHYPNCFSCPKCHDKFGLMYGKNCSADTKAVCVCKPGMFCPQPQSSCIRCKSYKLCKAGEGIVKNGTPTSDVRCAACPEGTFSSYSNTEPCKPHTRCEGNLVLRPGSSTADTECKATPSATTQVPPQTSASGNTTNPQIIVMRFQGKTPTGVHITITPSQTPLGGVTPNTAENQTLAASKSTPHENPLTVIYYIGIVVAIALVFLTLIVMMITCRLRKKGGLIMGATDNNKPQQTPSVSVTPDCQCLLPGDRCQKEPSMTSSDSQSQPDSSHSYSSSDWLERTSQEESLPEQLSISSPLVNLSITATFNCQLNPATASCSIPVSPSALAPQAQASVPLSQEEVCISCRQEDGKEALQSVQESGPCVF